MLLPWLILIPFIGGFLCWQTERFGVKVPRWIALITMGLTLALGLQLWLQAFYFTYPTNLNHRNSALGPFCSWRHSESYPELPTWVSDRLAEHAFCPCSPLSP